MFSVGVHEAKTTLSKLLKRVEGGEVIVINRDGKPVAKLVPVDEVERRVLGQDVGKFKVPDDFDAPLPESLLEAFEG